MKIGRTTICCSAAATLACVQILAAPTALSLLPLQPEWTVPIDGALVAPPVFDEMHGFLPLEGHGLAAYGLEHGDLRWTAATEVSSKPAVGDGLIFVPEPTGLVALRQSDGSEVWRLSMSDALAVPPVWDNGWLVTAEMSGEIRALRASDGHEIWRRRLDAPVSGLPALAADRVYVPVTDGRLVALLIETGQPVWERRVGGSAGDALAFEDRLYVGSTDNFFYSLNAEDGTVAWRWRTGADVIGPPAADARRVYFVALDNVLRALDRRSGSQIWRRTLPFRPMAGPLLAGDTLIASGLGPGLGAYSVEGGAPAGDLQVAGALAARPHVLLGGRLPGLVVVSATGSNGLELRKLTRRVDPLIAPLAPLPNAVPPM